MISKPPTTPDVQEDIPHQIVEWRIETVSWIFILLTILAALAGLLGPGPLSWVTRSSPDDSLTVEYARIQRYQSPEVMEIRAAASAIRDHELRIKICAPFIDRARIERIDPEPKEVIAGEKFYTYVFEAPPNQEPTSIYFHHELNKFGKIPLEVLAEGGRPVGFTVVVLP